MNVHKDENELNQIISSVFCLTSIWLLTGATGKGKTHVRKMELSLLSGNNQLEWMVAFAVKGHHGLEIFSCRASAPRSHGWNPILLS